MEGQKSFGFVVSKMSESYGFETTQGRIFFSDSLNYKKKEKKKDVYHMLFH